MMNKIPVAVYAMLLLAACSGPKSDSKIVIGDTISTASGLKYVYKKIGTGRPVETGSKVYTYLVLSVNGKEIWNTNDMKDSAFVFVANKDRMIKGFTEVTMKLREGDEIVAILPGSIAYGVNGAGSDIPPNATLIYDRYVMKKVDEPKASLSDTLFAAYRSGGHEKMLAEQQRILNSPDTAGYYYDEGQYRQLWNLLNDSSMHKENLQLVEYKLQALRDKQDKRPGMSSWRWYQVRTYEKLTQYKRALDSLDVLMKSDTTMAANDRAIRLRKELAEKVK